VIVSITGHRPSKLGKEYGFIGPYTDYIKGELFKHIDELKPSKIISGMALGVDQIWEKCGIRRGIRVVPAVPFEGQESVWPEKSKRLYKLILENSLVEKFVVSDGGYSVSKMQTRNEWMVDNSDILIAVWDGSNGGTANCVEYAESLGKKTIRINPNEAF